MIGIPQSIEHSVVCASVGVLHVACVDSQKQAVPPTVAR